MSDKYVIHESQSKIFVSDVISIKVKRTLLGQVKIWIHLYQFCYNYTVI